jgi:hypothetical protein
MYKIIYKCLYGIKIVLALNHLTNAIYLMIAYTDEVAKNKRLWKKQKMSFCPAPRETIVRGTHQRPALHVSRANLHLIMHSVIANAA